MDMLKHYGDVLLQMIGIFSSLWFATLLISLAWHKGKAKYPTVINNVGTTEVNLSMSKKAEK